MTLTDVVTLVPIIILVGLLFYFSNREIRQSLEQSKAAQEVLSQELRDARTTRLNELAKAAEFGRLSQGLFHDLMTPLTSIILHTEKLKETSLTREHVEKAVEASRRMASHIKDMRATLNREETERICVLKEELESVLRFLAFQAREKSIDVQVRADETSWFGSPTKLHQLFSNLISNSIDASNKNGKIEIEIKNNVIAVKDYGSGIKKEHLEKVFDPFFTTKPHDKGTGIGLTTVKRIVEKNIRGTIELESTEGVGTTITITFPKDSRGPASYRQPQERAPHLV